MKTILILGIAVLVLVLLPFVITLALVDPIEEQPWWE